MRRASWTPRLLAAPFVTGALGAGAVLLLAVRDPHEAGAYGTCPFLALTGLPCAGCGGLRAVHDLTQGDLGAALTSNALAVVAVLLGTGLWLRWTVRRAAGEDVPLVERGGRLVVAVTVVLVLFGVLRWLPGTGVLGP